MLSNSTFAKFAMRFVDCVQTTYRHWSSTQLRRALIDCSWYVWLDYQNWIARIRLEKCYKKSPVVSRRITFNLLSACRIWLLRTDSISGQIGRTMPLTGCSFFNLLPNPWKRLLSEYASSHSCLANNSSTGAYLQQWNELTDIQI